ncbi:MAG TPA: VOC family protein [Candidatus Dormibacteraeota bacterium]|nr:VOC family protein [Candidatus Dormibacteraeota bacterium]
MPDFSQSAQGLVPPAVIDHVLLPVGNLEDAARHMHDRYGLQANEGGRHATGGTANYIVPLGLHYFELIAVIEPAEVRDSHLGARVLEALREGKTFVAWALRTADLDAVRAKLLAEGWDLPPMTEGSRKRPDGQLLSWRTQDVEKAAGPTAMPFVIEWKIPDGLHPGEAAAAHEHGATAIKRVVVGAREPDNVRRRLAVLLGGSGMYDVRDSDSDGVEEVVLAHRDGETVIR